MPSRRARTGDPSKQTVGSVSPAAYRPAGRARNPPVQAATDDSLSIGRSEWRRRSRLTEPSPRAPSMAPSRPGYITLAGRIRREDSAALTRCVCARAAAREPGPLACDVGGLEDPDMGTVDALARMALSARRLGRRVELRRAKPDLVELLVLAGLGALAVEVVGEAEEREEPGRVEKEHDPADPIA
ncbi:MAG: STAS domain-containing protein [Chloroflexota bacterium]